MTKNCLKVFYYVLNYLCIILGCVLCANGPCPNLFQYQYDGDEWSGVIAIPSLPYGTPVRLQVRMSLARALPTKYAGHIELIGPRPDILSAILQERPLRYKVNFPLPYPLPQLTAIRLNEQVICTGPPVAGPIITSITLDHALYPHGQNLNSHRRPSQQPIDPEFQPEQPPITLDVRPGNNLAPPAQTTPLTPVQTTPAQEGRTPSIAQRNIYSEVCGAPMTVSPLIANGETVTRGSYPWLVAIFAQKSLGLEFTCGGNLISRSHVITAAHCIKSSENREVTANELLLMLGKYRIHKWTEAGSVAREADLIVMHPEYQSLNSDADLAVIRMVQEVEFTPTIRPICVWFFETQLPELVGQKGTIVGWGRDETGQKITTEPRQTQVLVVSQEDCLRSRLEFRYITSNRTLCAGGEAGAGPCTGDSGGGLLVKRENKWFLRGIISMSLTDAKTKSCDLNNYSVFVDMAKFVSWVMQFVV